MEGQSTKVSGWTNDHWIWPLEGLRWPCKSSSNMLGSRFWWVLERMENERVKIIFNKLATKEELEAQFIKRLLQQREDGSSLPQHYECPSRLVITYIFSSHPSPSTQMIPIKPHSTSLLNKCFFFIAPTCADTLKHFFYQYFILSSAFLWGNLSTLVGERGYDLACRNGNQLVCAFIVRGALCCLGNHSLCGRSGVFCG